MSPLVALPTELLAQIAGLLLPHDTKSLASTCRALQEKLTVQSNYLWFTFLTTLPHLRHSPVSLHAYYIDNPPPVCATTGKFNSRVDHYARAMEILRGRILGCFDCFNVNRKSFRKVYIGKIYYRMYCASCYQRYFWPLKEFRYNWPEIDLPATLVGAVDGRDETIHYKDAIFLIKDQLPPRARSANGRFISKWEIKLRDRKQRYSPGEDFLWKFIDRRMMSGTGIDGTIKVMLWVYQNDERFRRFWKLLDKEDLRAYLESSALNFLGSLPQVKHGGTWPNTAVDGGRFDLDVSNVGRSLWRATETVLRADDEHTGENSWSTVEGGRKAYLKSLCENNLLRIFGVQEGGVQQTSFLVTGWIARYTTERVGTARKQSRFAPYICTFCREEGPGEKSSSFMGLYPLPHMPALATHIFMRHNDRFAEPWVTGGGVVEPMRENWKPVWAGLRALDSRSF